MNTKFIDLVNAGLKKAMELDDTVIHIGQGINDRVRMFGATRDLVELFGSERVIDPPTAEGMMTGLEIGLSLNGFRPIASHNRVDFLPLAMDQIVNGAAKWNAVFGKPINATVRAIIGRGWGQGPTHCQSLQSWFAHIPGLKVVMPSLPEEVYGLLLSSIFDDNPVIFLEHRWLHNMAANPNYFPYQFVPLGKANLLREGSDITIVSMSYMTIEALHAVEYLNKHGVHCDLIDLRTIQPLDWETLYKSVKKTGNLLVLDTDFEFCSVASEVIAKVSMDCFADLRSAPKRLAMPDYSVLTSPTLATPMYVYSDDIAQAVCDMCDCSIDLEPMRELRSKSPKDTPGQWFAGPF